MVKEQSGCIPYGTWIEADTTKGIAYSKSTGLCRYTNQTATLHATSNAGSSNQARQPASHSFNQLVGKVKTKSYSRWNLVNICNRMRGECAKFEKDPIRLVEAYFNRNCLHVCLMFCRRVVAIVYHFLFLGHPPRAFWPRYAILFPSASTRCSFGIYNAT